MIQIENASKYFGEKLALDVVSFEAMAGEVTALIGPNGAGKTTLFRCMLGLDRFDAGEALFDGIEFASLANPSRHVGVMLDGRYGHPGRTALQQLKAQAIASGVSTNRVLETLELVGLSAVAKKRISTYSLGMKQRLGLAMALLGDPHTLILDEPLNGLDSDGITWVRNLLRQLASQGKTVLLASHFMSEVENTADHIVILAKGRVLSDASLGATIRPLGVRVASPDLEALIRALAASQLDFEIFEGYVAVQGIAPTELGRILQDAGVSLSLLQESSETVESAFARITSEFVEFTSSAIAG